jgi:hypothetical protein
MHIERESRGDSRRHSIWGGVKKNTGRFNKSFRTGTRGIEGQQTKRTQHVL